MSLALNPVTTTSVLFPLYEYPETPTTWNPLYSAITSNPSVDFYVIVNPDSGPGDSEYPDSSYAPALQRLNTISPQQVTTLGYVDVKFGGETIEAVEAIVAKYKNWDTFSASSPISVDGIFFDDVPDTAAEVSYMTALSNSTKAMFGPDRGFVVFNPGTTVNPGYFNAADAVVIFEDTESEFSENVFSEQSGGTPRQKGVIINTFTGGASEQTSVVDAMVSHQPGFIYITDQRSYDTFSGLFSSFVSALAAALA
jgi:hypothetical protein